MWSPGNRRVRICTMSAMAAPRGEVTMPMRRGKGGDRALAFGGEETFGGQFLLELFKGELQRAEPLGLDEIDDQLVFAARLVDVDAAARHHRETVLRLALPEAMGGAEGDRLDLGLA